MREIKFRGKRHYDGVWVYGCPLVVDTEKYQSANIVTLDEVYQDTLAKVTTSVDFKTLGQFTGLHDKNGCEIFEGDIVKWLEIDHATRDVMEPPEDYIKECMDVVVFSGGAFTVEEAQYPDMAFLCKDYHYNETDLFEWVCNLDDFPGVTTDDMYICEVVGNVHDRPNLFEEK